MTLELYDLSFHSPTPNFNIMDFISFRSGSTRYSSLRKMHIPFNPSNRSRHFYFSRLPRLWNSLPLPTLDPSIKQLSFDQEHLYGQVYVHVWSFSALYFSFLLSLWQMFHFISPLALLLTSQWRFFFFFLFFWLLVNWASCPSVHAFISLPLNFTLCSVSNCIGSLYCEV